MGALQHITDYTGQSRSLITTTGSGMPYQQLCRIDTTLTSTYDAMDSVGNSLRTIIVPGIILAVEFAELFNLTLPVSLSLQSVEKLLKR